MALLERPEEVGKEEASSMMAGMHVIRNRKGVTNIDPLVSVLENPRYHNVVQHGHATPEYGTTEEVGLVCNILPDDEEHHKAPDSGGDGNLPVFVVASLLQAKKQGKCRLRLLSTTRLNVEKVVRPRGPQSPRGSPRASLRFVGSLGAVGKAPKDANAPPKK